MFRSAEYEAWLDECLYLLRRQDVKPIGGRYKLVICVRKPDKRRRDIDNVGGGKAVNDMLQKAGIVEDDCLCDMVLCSWVASGPDTIISICSEGDEHELSEAIARALQGGKEALVGPPASTRNHQAQSPAPAFGTMSHKEYLAAVAASRPVVGKRRKGNRSTGS